MSNFPHASCSPRITFGWCHRTRLFLYRHSSSSFSKRGFQPFFGPVTRRTPRGAQGHGFPSRDQGWNEGSQGQETPSLPSSSSTSSRLWHVCFFTTLVFFLYSHEVARFPCIAFSFSFSNFLHAFHMRFFGILFSQLFYPFGDGPCSFRNSRNHCVDPFPRLGTLFSSASSSSFRRHDD